METQDTPPIETSSTESPQINESVELADPNMTKAPDTGSQSKEILVKSQDLYMRRRQIIQRRQRYFGILRQMSYNRGAASAFLYHASLHQRQPDDHDSH